jgi:hypothetical protein
MRAFRFQVSVLFTLCTLFFLLGCLAAAAWQIWRRTTRPRPHERLLRQRALLQEQLGLDAIGSAIGGREQRDA